MNIQLIPLDLARLDALARDPTRLDDLPVAPGALPPPFILDAARAALAQGRDMRWHSPCAFVDTEQALVAGSGGFKGAPQAGRVELGYGVAEQQQGRGIATAAVAALIRLARAEPEVHELYAETAVANIASRRVVEKNGLQHVGRRESEEDGPVDCWLLSLSKLPPRLTKCTL